MNHDPNNHGVINNSPIGQADTLPSSRTFKPLTWALICFGIGLAMSFVVYGEQKNRNQKSIEHQLSIIAQQAADAISTQLKRYEYGLRGTRGFVLAVGADNMRRDQFARYISARNLAFEFRGERGIGFVRRVPRSTEEFFVENARSDGWPEFTIHQLAPHEGEKYVVQYIEPVNANLAAVGFDLASEKNRRDAAIAASETGEARLTGPITLVVKDTNEQKSFLMLLPVYTSVKTPSTLEERKTETIGWINAPLSMHEVLGENFSNKQKFHLVVSDISSEDGKDTFFNLEETRNPESQIFHHILDIDVYGRHWRIEVSGPPSFVHDLDLPNPFLWLILGGLFSAVFSACVFLAINIQKRKREEEFRIVELNTILEAQIEGRTRELTETKQMLREVIDAVPSMIGYWDTHLINHVANKAYSDWFGVDPKGIPGQTMRQLLGDELFQKNLPYVQAALRGEPQTFERSITHLNGTIRHSIAYYLPKIFNNVVQGFYVIVNDVTQAKISEKETKRLNHLFSSVLAAASEISIIATDSQGIIKIFNSGAEKMLGYSADEVVEKYTPALLHDLNEIIQRGKELSAEYNSAIEGFNVFTHKPELDASETRHWTYIRKDGRRLTVSLSVTCMRNETGQVLGYLGVATDITQKIIQERALIETRDQLLTASEVADLGVWTWDLVNGVLEWNDRMFSMYDQPIALRSEGLSYAHWRDRIHEDDVVQTETNLMACIAGQGDFESVFRIRNTRGDIQYIQGRAKIICDASGKAQSAVGINRDITAQQKYELKLRFAKQQADTANAAKSAFLASMSHEIRTPMNAVLGMLQLVQRTHLTERQHDYINKAQIAGKSLLGLLNDVLDFSKIDAGKLQLESNPLNFEDVLRELSIILSSNLGEKKILILCLI